MSAYGPLAMVADVLSGIYAWVTSLCCAVTCSTQSMQVNERNLRVVKLLAEGGGSRVMVVSRGGRVARDRQGLAAQLAALGTAARVTATDASDEAGTVILLATSLLMGVLHAAGVLRDALVRTISIGDFDIAFAPKALAASRVRMAVSCTPLEVLAPSVG